MAAKKPYIIALPRSITNSTPELSSTAANLKCERPARHRDARHLGALAAQGDGSNPASDFHGCRIRSRGLAGVDAATVCRCAPRHRPGSPRRASPIRPLRPLRPRSPRADPRAARRSSSAPWTKSPAQGRDGATAY